jgi:tetratricopeptide (TPR) repeat protein
VSIDDISDPAVRQALELAKSYSDDMSTLVHPVTEIDEAKAREIERLAGLARKQIAKAAGSPEPGVADYVQLLNLTIRQFEGLALAFGRDKLGQGASLIESAVADFEKLSKGQGSTETMPQSYHVLGLIYMAMGRKERAVNFFRRAVEAAPDDIDYRRSLDEAENENAALVFARSPQGKLAMNVGGSLLKGVGLLLFLPFIIAWKLFRSAARF